MEKINLDQETEDWLIAFFNGELEENEIEKIGEWLENSEENRNAYETLMRDYLQLRWAQEDMNIQEKRAKEIIFSSLKKRKSRKLYYGMAAAVALLFVFTGYWFLGEKTRTSPVEVVQTEIKPVQSRAILVLSSGEKVDLEKSHEEIRERDGSVVKVDSSLGIRYDLLDQEEKTELLYHKIVVPRGGEYFLTLGDGTEVWLDADSELEYPVCFAGDRREVRLKGEAYFKVVKEEGKPFIVQVGTYTVQVYGTEFNVNAYDPRQIETVLVRGSVGFKANPSMPERMLKPNELAITNVESGESEIRTIDILPYVAWKNKDIVFVNECLESIMENVSRWYDVQVFFQNEELKDLRFDCNMQRYASIEDLFFFMEKTSNARFTINGRTVVISKK